MIGYFKYYFNTVYRNTVAHGNYHLLFVQYKDRKINPPEDLVMELVAHELLFDLNYFVVVIAKSNEIDAASMYLYQTKSQLSAKNTKVDLKEDAEKHLNYDRLLLDLIGESRYNYSNYLHGFFVSYETVQILYWIFNPYYEDEVGIEIVKPIREALLSTDFWKYALQHFESWLWVKDGESFKKAVVKMMPLLKTNNTEAFKYAIEINKKL